jgi:hypothetical protein
MELITVSYNRKVSRNYESVAIGGSLEFKPTSEDVQEEYKKNLAVLKLIVDAELSEQEPMSGGTFDKAAPVEDDGLPDLGEPPAWVGHLDDEKPSETQSAPPPPPAPAKPTPAAEAPAERTAPTSTTTSDGGIYLAHAKVFRSEMKRGKQSGKVYAELRVGHDDLQAHVNNQYITVKIYEPEYVSMVGSLSKMKNEETGEIRDVSEMNIKEGEFVDIWGRLTAWRSDPSKHDLTAQALKLSE